jgi:hypothetical protein
MMGNKLVRRIQGFLSFVGIFCGAALYSLEQWERSMALFAAVIAVMLFERFYMRDDG